MIIPSEQLLLNLRPPAQAKLTDFAGTGYKALRMAAEWLLTGDNTLMYLYGVQGSGRSHFLWALCEAAESQGKRVIWLPMMDLVQESAEVFQAVNGYDLIACDDIDVIAQQPQWEEALFHLFNRARSEGSRLVFSARQPATQVGFHLPDLVSRLALAPPWELTLPDDESRRALLLEVAKRRGLVMESAVLDWLIRWAPRQPAALLDFINRADQASLMEGRRLTVPFLKGFLDLKSEK
jgi:DnaA family protein